MNPPTMPQNLLIIGATGAIGTYITEAIVNNNLEFGRMCVLTSRKTLIEKVREICALESYGAEVFVGDLEDEDFVKDAYRGIDTIVSCVGRAGIEKQLRLIKWAAECDVKRFYASEYGTDIEYWPHSVREPPHQMKLKVRAYMKEIQRESNLEYTYLVTGPYADLYMGPFRANPEVGSFSVREKKAILLGTGNEEISFTAMADVGKFVVASLLNPLVSRNATLVVHSFTASPNQILAEYERQTNSKWEVTYTSLEKLRELEREAYQMHKSVATVITLRRIWSEGGTLFKYYDDSLLGPVDTETLEDQVRVQIEKQMVRDPGDMDNPLRRLSTV